MTETIIISRDGAIATVILNRPKKLNALTRNMWSCLGEAMTELSVEDEIRCVVLRGAGGKACKDHRYGGELKFAPPTFFAVGHAQSFFEHRRAYHAYTESCSLPPP